MNVAFDFDKTWTRDPDVWRTVAKLLHGRGHKCYLVTRRKEHTPDIDRFYIPTWMPQIFCAGALKRDFCEALGIHIDIWIDDEPGTIERCRILDDSTL